ncbi:hypothetical protein H7F33_09915 [Pedobacter sp. PAMC26386]|nr:hypothetical protein H7F33_09915 [Pedobacter sp. PAMC26386]
MEIEKQLKFLLTIGFILWSMGIKAQDTAKISITTSVGLVHITGKLGNTFKSAVAFNTGLELQLKHNWFIQGEISFNTLGYHQQVRDAGSTYLFTNANSSLLQVGGIGGKDFTIQKDKWFIGLYLGAGYLNIGEPRITVDVANNTARQDVVRMSNIYGKGGSRISYKTKSPFFQTVYLDASYFASPVKLQGEHLNGISLFIGTKFSLK